MKALIRKYLSWTLLPVLALSLLPLCVGCRSFVRGGEERPASSRAPEKQADLTDPELEDLLLLSEALLLVRRSYVREVSYRELIYAAVDGMVKRLDRNSAFLPPDSLQALEESTTGHFSGIGLSVGSDPSGIKVLSPVKGGPAEEAGVRSGDLITGINGEPLKGLPLKDAIRKIRGKKGEALELSIERPSGERVQVPLSRREVKLSAVKGVGMAAPEIGYLRISKFTASVPDDFAEALKGLKGRGARALIIDLRGNPGGLLRSAVSVAGQLLPRNALIVSVRGRQRDGTPERYTSGMDFGKESRFPLVLLVNRTSASASEILAGALKAHRRALLVGERTFGKASVQNILHFALRKECALKLTTAHYLTPDGRQIDGRGVDPDIEIPLSPSEWRRVQVESRYREMADTAPSFTLPTLYDPQLERAKQVLKKTLESEKN